MNMKHKKDFLVGVSVYNTTDFLLPQIENLKNCVRNCGLDIEIRYFDDGSKPSKKDEFHKICSDHGVGYEYHQHKGFGHICNVMGEYGKNAEFTLLLDSDVFLPEYFFRHAWQIMDMGKEFIGVLSYKSIKAKLLDGYKLTIGESETYNIDAFSGEYIKPEVDTQLATYCFMFEHKKFAEIGGFNSEYLAYYSDSDFCCKMAEAGYESFRIHFPKVFHIEHGTLLDPENKFDCDKLREHDLKVFMDYWEASPQQMQKYCKENL